MKIGGCPIGFIRGDSRLRCQQSEVPGNPATRRGSTRNILAVVCGTTFGLLALWSFFSLEISRSSGGFRHARNAAGEAICLSIELMRYIPTN